MLEELLNSQEHSKSILIIDDIKNEGTLLLYSIINKLIERNSSLIHLYPCFFRAKDNFETYFGSNITIHDVLTNYIFLNKNASQCCFKTIIGDLDAQMKQAIENEQKKSSQLFLENLNLLLRHFNNNPFKIINFVLEISKRTDVSSLYMVINKDSIDETVLNQISSVFQTVIYLKELNDSVKKTETINYDIQLIHKNIKSSKVKFYDETVCLNDKFEIEKIEKRIKKLKKKVETEEVIEEDPLFKGLTFNVHLNDGDLEAKKNLILPYELIGQSNPVTTPTTAQQRMADAIKEDSKIYYAPDETDDVDDDDPDDDLNF